MSIQDFQQIPDSYSSMKKYHDLGIFENYPDAIKTIYNVIMDDKLDFVLGGSPYNLSYNMSLLMGNYMPDCYSKDIKNAADSLLKMKKEYLEAKEANRKNPHHPFAYLHNRPGELQWAMVALFSDKILREIKTINANNFALYKKQSLASFPAVLLKAKYLDLLAHRFIRCFFQFLCYSPQKDKLIAIENAIKNGRRLILQEDGDASVTPEFASDVFDLRVCIEYHDATCENDPWDTSYLRAKVPLNGRRRLVVRAATWDR